MKNLFFSLMFLIACNSVYGQAPGQFAFTFSEIAGNGPMPDMKGYIYNFNNGSAYNCIDHSSAFNRQFSDTKIYEESYDSIAGHIILQHLSLDDSRFHCSLIHDNCQIIFALDLSEPQYHTIEIRLKSSVDIENFYPKLAYTNNGFFEPLSSSGYALEANEWNVIRYTYTDLTEEEAANICGFSFDVDFKEGYDDQFLENPAVITIDYVKIGSAVDDSESNISRNGFLLNTAEVNFCPRFINVLNNPAFEYGYNLEEKTFEIEQIQIISSNQFIANVFSDQNCFFSFVDFSDPQDRKLTVSIKPQYDVPYFGIDLNGYTTEGIWDVGKITNFVSLVGGEWNEVTFELDLETPNNTYLDPQRITGYGFMYNYNINDQRVNSEFTNLFKIKEIKAGQPARNDAVTSIHQNEIISVSPFKIYPNPAHDSFSVLMPFESGNITIINQMGQKVKHFREVKNNEKISLNLQNGIYVVQATNGKFSYNQILVVE